MSELNTNLYFKHPNSDTHNVLKVIFKSSESGNEDIKIQITKIAQLINPEQGKQFANELFECVDEVCYDLNPESVIDRYGYCSLHFVHGNSGDEVITSIIEFLGKLCPRIDARASLLGDDDSWEIFYRWIDNSLVMKEYEPDYYEAEIDTLPDVYIWWHNGLPEEIKDGFINLWKENDEESDD